MCSSRRASSRASVVLPAPVLPLTQIRRASRAISPALALAQRRPGGLVGASAGARSVRKPTSAWSFGAMCVRLGW
jgi:hypothetical protein